MKTTICMSACSTLTSIYRAQELAEPGDQVVQCTVSLHNAQHCTSIILMLMVLLTGQDYSPTHVLMGSLPEDAIADSECFTFSAIQDNIGEGTENFSVVLQSVNNVMISGTGAIRVANDEMTISILESTPTLEPVEGMYMHACPFAIVFL